MKPNTESKNMDDETKLGRWTRLSRKMSRLNSSFKKSCGQKLLAFILSLIAVLLLPIPLLFVVLPTLIIRKIVALLALIFRPGFANILTHRSTNLCLEEFHDHTESVILGDNIIEGNFPLESFKTRFTERVINRKLPNGKLKYPELQQFAVNWMNFKFWKHENTFDISEHIRLYNDSRSSGLDGVVTQKEFHAMRSTFLNSQFPKNKSPWEIIIVHNYEPDDPVVRARAEKPICVLLTKLHHSLGDGFSINKLLGRDFFENHHQNLEASSNNKPARDRVNNSSWAVGLKTLWSCVTFPFRLVYEFMTISLQLMKKSPWHVEEERQAPAVHAFSKIISVSRVKWIKDQLGVSFTSVLFHVCNEAMLKMMEKKGMEPSDNVVAIIPLPLPNHPDKLRNHMTHAAIPLPTSPELTPKQRLEIVHRHYEELRYSTLPLSAAWLTLIIGGMFTSLGRLLVRGLVPPIVISSFPGPKHLDFNLDGHKLLSSYANVGLLNLSGLFLLIVTQGDDLKFGVTANSNILNEDDVQEFVDILEREVGILEDEIVPEKVSIADKS